MHLPNFTQLSGHSENRNVAVSCKTESDRVCCYHWQIWSLWLFSANDKRASKCYDDMALCKVWRKISSVREKQEPRTRSDARRTNCFALLISSRKCNKPRLERLHKSARFTNIFSLLNFSSKCAFSGDRKENRAPWREEFLSYRFTSVYSCENDFPVCHLIYHKFTRVIISNIVHCKIKLLAL